MASFVSLTVHSSYKAEFPEIIYNQNAVLPWECPTCHGQYKDTILNIENGIDNCPYCSNKKALKGFNDLTITHPDVTKEWGIENYLLGNGAPEEYTFKNTKIVW